MPPDGASPEPRPPKKFLDVVADAIRRKHLSYRTEKSYVNWVRRFILFHDKRHPREMGAPEVRQFLSHLATEARVSASTQNQALNALVFLFHHVLNRELGDLGQIERAKRSIHLPVVLSQDEVGQVLRAMDGTTRLMAELLYGTGMRLMECHRLRVKDVDFDLSQIVVRQGKGQKDRITVLPERLRDPLRRHLERVRSVWEQDQRNQIAGVELPFALAVKYPHAGPRMGLAMGVSNARLINRSAIGDHPPTPHPSKPLAKSIEEGPTNSRSPRAGWMPFAPSLVRHAPA